MLYMGKDKFENEALIKYSWPEDIWYHVDRESSAHVYIRLPREQYDAAMKAGDKDWYKKIDEKVVEDCCQLVKANSIKGNKQDNVSIVFTPASNLKKTQGMDTGQVGFHDEGQRWKTKVEARKNEIVNRLEKTKKWEDTDLEADFIRRKKEESTEKARAAEKERIEREAQEKKWKEEKEAKSYDRLYDESLCTRAGEIELDSDGEPDFM